jgi:signal peptidase
MPGPGENDDSDAGEPASPEDESVEEEPPTSTPDFSGEESLEDHTPDEHSTGTRSPDQSAAGGPSPNQSVGGPRADRRPQSKRGPAAETEDDEASSWVLVFRDVVITVLAVALIGGYLFAISGVWPPMVAIESGSMEPNMNVNDMVFVMDNDRFEPAAAQGGTGVVTAHSGEAVGYTQYGKSGDVIIFEPGGDEDATPIIHRAMFWVEGGENWYDRANESYIGAADSCAELSACPAPNAGFITKGDANSGYDQASFGGSNNPVKPDWVVGTAELRAPRLGWFRLQL